MTEVTWNWSKSRVKGYRACPLAFQCSEVLKLPRAEVESLAKGTWLHLAFEKFYLYGDMKKTLEEIKFPEQYLEKYGHHISNFLNWNEAWKKRPYISEGKQVVGNIVGVVDRIDKLDDNSYIVIDYKSSEGTSIEGYEDELLLYAYIAKHKYKLNITQIAIYFSGNNKFVVKDITDEEIEKNHADIQEEIALYTEAIEFDCFEPHKGVHCNWCSFKKYCKLYGGSLPDEKN